jgi:hypothetical protein
MEMTHLEIGGKLNLKIVIMELKEKNPRGGN